MDQITSIYRQAAIVLWGVVCLVAGLSIGYYFEMETKKIFLTVVVVLGIYLLTLINMLRKKPASDTRGVDEPGSQKPGLGQVSDLHAADEGTSRPLDNLKINTDKEGAKDGREWLDDFLVKQQKEL